MALPDIDLAAQFLVNGMYASRERRRAFYESCNAPLPPNVSFGDWIVFCSALTGDTCASPDSRAELSAHVVKASPIGRAFGYKFDWEFGAQEQAEDQAARHLFVSYSADLKQIDVRRADGSAVIAQLQSEWGERIGQTAQPSDAPFDLEFSWVVQNAEIIAMFNDGQPVYSSIT